MHFTKAQKGGAALPFPVERSEKMLKILIAEDDHDLRQLFSHVLIKHG